MLETNIEEISYREPENKSKPRPGQLRLWALLAASSIGQKIRLGELY